MKRFYRVVSVRPSAGGFVPALDDKPLRTPARAECAVPARALADAVAAEWEAQGDRIDPRAMPLTRAVNAAIDRVMPDPSPVVDAVAGYAETDLICHRAPHPEALIARQAEAWDPLLDWSVERFGARLVPSVGVMPVRQAPEALARLRAAVEVHDPWELTALHELVSLSGSLVIGLTVSDGWLGVEAAWRAGRIDEDWNMEQWGEDEEAAAQRAVRARDFAAAARLLSLLRG